MAVSVGELLAYLRLDSTQFDRGITVARQGMTSAASTAGELGGAVGMTEAAFANAGRQASVAASGTAKFRAAQLGVTAATERYNAVLADENATIRQLALAEKGLITANERLRATTPIAPVGFRGAAGEMDAAAIATGRMGGAMASTLGMAKSLGLMFGAFEIVKKSIDITKEAAAFQKQMTMIQTNAGQSAAEVKRLTPAVLALAGPVGTAPEQLALSLYHVEQNGIHGAKALDVLTTAAKGAKVGNADLEETTNSMTAAVASGIPGVKNLDQAMGALIATVGTGDMKMSDLNEALGSGMLVKVKAYGLTLRDVGAALAVFGDNNVRGADAATMVVQAVQAMAKPAAGGKKALADIGLSVDALKKDMQEGGLNKAILDLNDHLKTAGITGVKTGGFLLEAFGKKQAAGISVLLGQVDRLETKYADLDKGSASFGSRWEATTKTVAFAFDRIKADFESGGIVLANKLMPALSTAAHWLGTDLPHALSVLQATLAPVEHDVAVVFVDGWHAASLVLGVAATALGAVGHFLAEHKTLVKDVVVPVLAMWAAWKGFLIVSAAARAINGAVLAIKADMGALGTTFRNSGAAMRGLGTESGFVSASLKADMLATVAADDAAAVKITEAEAKKAEAYLETARASGTATDEEIASAEEAALAARAQAAAAVDAAAVTSAASEEAAATVVASGDAAAAGWTAMLGPLALVAVAATAVFSLFSSGSSETSAVSEAVDGLTAALKADSDALGANVRAQIEDNLVKAGAYQMALKIGISQKTLTDAAMGNAAALDEVNAAVDKGVHGSDHQKLATLIVASALGTQTKALKEAVQGQKDKTAADGKSTKAVGENTDALSGNAAAAGDASKETIIAAGAQQEYAKMMGLVLNASGGTRTAADLAAAAIKKMSTAYQDATATGTEFLTALQSFSKLTDDSVSSADRAALIGATLKAANGDALAYVGAMASATSATDSLVQAFKDQATQLAQQSKDQANAADKVTAAQKRVDELRGNSKTKASTLATAENTLAKAQQAAAKAGSLVIGDTERTALAFDKAGKASIDYTKKGAAPLVQQLQAMQTAAMAAAEATFQHEVATKGAKQAADDAYQIYKTQTQGSLIDQAAKLGITVKQAQALATTYFGMPADVKTTIEAEGTDPILTVLNKIGKLLADFTGQPWDAKVSAPGADAVTTQLDGILTRMGKINGAAVVAHISAVDDLKGQNSAGDYGPTPHKSAVGGYVSGPGTSTSDSIPYRLSNGEFVVNAAATARLRPQLEAANRSKGTAAFASPNAGAIVKQFTYAPTINNPLKETSDESLAISQRRFFAEADGM